MLSLAWEFLARFDILTILWLEKRLQEHLTKRVIWIFIDLGMILLLRVELFGLLGKLVDRNLSHDQREVLSGRLVDLILLIGRSCNMGLIRQFKLSLHVVETCRVLLDSFLFIFVILFAGFLGWLDLLKKVLVTSKQLLGVDFANLAEGNIWDFVFKSTMDEDVVAGGPAGVSESLN